MVTSQDRCMYSMVLPKIVPFVYNNPDQIPYICDIRIKTILVQNMLLTRPNPAQRQNCFDHDLEIQGPL